LDSLAAVDAWTLHDLRRTTASGMARLGVPPHILAAVLNHDQRSIQTTIAIYNKYRYSREKAEASWLWGQHVTGLVAGSGEKVVALRA
jgi:integrase